MNWITVSVFTTAEGIDSVCGCLMNAGINGFEIEDNEDFLTFLEENKQFWDYVDEDLLEAKKAETRVKFYVSDNEAGKEQLNLAHAEIEALKEFDKEKKFGRLDFSYENISEEDWANNWKQYFKPTLVGEKMLICPEWEEVPEDNNRVVFKVNPGMSFGTGTHFSTQLCIEEIEKYIKGGEVILDLGCGSGILSIIARLLGAKEAYAVDIDPNCVGIAYDNAEMNGVSKENYHVTSGNVLTDNSLIEELSVRKYDAVFANIVADVIMPLGKIVPRFLKDDGLFIVSGIIKERLDEVTESLKESGFTPVTIRTRGDWAALTLKVIK